MNDTCSLNERSNEATRNRPEGDRVIEAASMDLNLPAFVRQIKDEEAWRKNDRNSITVFKSAGMRMVLGGLHKDAEMLPHKAPGVMSIHLLEGALEVTTDQLDTTLYSGHVVVVHKGCNYRVVATEESIYLLTITG